jgi:hypothetical protein
MKSDTRLISISDTVDTTGLLDSLLRMRRTVGSPAQVGGGAHTNGANATGLRNCSFVARLEPVDGDHLLGGSCGADTGRRVP